MEDKAIYIHRDAPIIAGVVQPKGSITNVDGEPIQNMGINDYLHVMSGNMNLGLTGLSRRSNWGLREQWIRTPWQSINGQPA